VRAAAAAVPGGAAARCGIPSATLIHAVADAQRASNVMGGAPLPDVVSRLARWAVVIVRPAGARGSVHVPRCGGVRVARRSDVRVAGNPRWRPCC
jgi:hypothetical protein